MVLELKRSTVAYRCPACGNGVLSMVDAFKLKADMVKLKCDCGKSEMTIIQSSDKKIRFTVPCMLCPKPHNFTVNEALFFDKELFVLPCPYSDINIAMMGEMNHVKAELSRTELELLDMLEKSGLESFESIHSESYLTDPQVLEIISYVIKELDEEGKIYCKCPEGVEGRYEVEMTKEGLKVTCLECGATKTVSTNSLIQATDFLNADSLTLE